MFETPKFGWAKIILENHDGSKVWENTASYITDVFHDTVVNMTLALDYNIPFCMEYDGEGRSFMIMSSDSTIAADIDYGEKIQICDKSKVELAREIYHDLSKDIDSWVDFTFLPSKEDDESIEDLRTNKEWLKLKKNMESDLNGLMIAILDQVNNPMS